MDVLVGQTALLRPERDQLKRRDVTKTYIFDKVDKYIIVLECQRGKGYYLLTAYHMDRPYSLKQIQKKMKHALGPREGYKQKPPLS